jgi:hypothetical protein
MLKERKCVLALQCTDPGGRFPHRAEARNLPDAGSRDEAFLLLGDDLGSSGETGLDDSAEGCRAAGIEISK